MMKIYTFQKDRVIIVPVKLVGPRGEKWTSAILDTGATYSMFTPAVIRAIGCDLTAIDATVKIITASSVEYVPFVAIPSIEVFGYSIKNIMITSHLLPPSTPAQGLIGINILNHFDFEFRFSKGEFIVEPLDSGPEGV